MPNKVKSSRFVWSLLFAAMIGMIIWALLPTGNQRRGGHEGVSSKSLTQSTISLTRGGRGELKPDAFETLLNEWKLLANTPGFKPGIIAKETRKLTQKSVETLLPGNRLVELIQRLEARGTIAGEGVFKREIAKVFAESSLIAQAARSALIAMKTDNEDALMYKRRWSYLASLGLPSEQFTPFSEALVDPIARQEAFFGQSLRLAETTPLEAISQLLAKRAEGKRSPNFTMIVPRVVLASMQRADADYAKIEQRLPMPTKEVSAANRAINGVIRARQELFRHWAKSAPADAANYALEHYDRLGPESFGIIAERVAIEDPHRAVDWVQRFPVGAIRDNAVRSVIMQIADRFPEESKQLAQSIEDVQMKEEALKRVLMADRFKSDIGH